MDADDSGDSPCEVQTKEPPVGSVLSCGIVVGHRRDEIKKRSNYHLTDRASLSKGNHCFGHHPNCRTSLSNYGDSATESTDHKSVSRSFRKSGDLNSESSVKLVCQLFGYFSLVLVSDESSAPECSFGLPLERVEISTLKLLRRNGCFTSRSSEK